MQHCWDRDSAVCGWDRRCLGHEVEVEEFDELELDFSACFAGLKDRCDSQESIEVLECARVLRRFYEGACKGDDSCGLDGWAVDWFEEIKEMLSSIIISTDPAIVSFLVGEEEEEYEHSYTALSRTKS